MAEHLKKNRKKKLPPNIFIFSLHICKSYSFSVHTALYAVFKTQACVFFVYIASHFIFIGCLSKYTITCLIIPLLLNI